MFIYLKKYTWNVITEAHSTQCHHTKVTGSDKAPILHVMKNAGGDQYKQSYSQHDKHCSTKQAVQSRVLEAFHAVSQFLIEVADASPNIS